MIFRFSRAALAVSALVVFSGRAACAQTAAASDVGVLGQRYVEAWGGRTEPEDAIFFDRKNEGGMALNLPVARALDVSVGGSFGKGTGTSVPGLLLGSIDFPRRERSASLAMTAYLRRGIVAPFVRLSGGWEKSTETRAWGPRGTIPAGRIEVRDHSTEWTAGGGAEILVGRVAITPAVTYFNSDREPFSGEGRRAWSYAVKAHLWLTKSLGGFVQAEHTRANENVDYRAWSWGAGVRFRF